jgi:hypothetical protein
VAGEELEEALFPGHQRTKPTQHGPASREMGLEDK